MSNNRHASKKVLGHVLSELMTLEGRVYRGKEIKLDMTKRFKISLSYNQAWRAKCYAIELLRGSPAASFQMLPLYLHNLKLHNPGSITNLLTDEKDQFVMCYMSVGAVIRTFVNYTRPVITIDGAHLKGGYLGTNLLAVAMDGNNGILPLAYGIGASETNDVWTWFLGNLRDSLLSHGFCVENLTIISDRAPSIAASISSVFPEAFHALCCRHLLMNLRSRSSKISHYEWHYWKMCKAYRRSDFDHHFGVISRRLQASAKVLRDVGPERWSRHHATRVRYAYLTSNSAESMNALSKHARRLPVTMLLEFFRSSVQQWYYKHRNTGIELKTPVTSYAEHKIGKRNGKSRGWMVNPSTNMICEVVDGNKNGTVNLENRTCTCLQWQLSGLPCGHVMAVARFFKQDDVTCYAERYFTTETYRAAYSEAIKPMTHPSEWVDPGDLQTVLPPILVKRQSGRPPGRARIPSKGEEKKEPKQTCSRCKERGHSRSSCMAPYDKTYEHIGSRTKSRSTSKSHAKVKVEQSEYDPSQSFPSVHLGHN